MTRLTLDWDTVFSAGSAPSKTSLGTVDLTFATSAAVGGAPTSQSSTVQSTELGASTEGHLLLGMQATASGQGFVQTINFDETGFSNRGVTDVAFELLDVDRFFFEDQVQIIAYDTDGNALPSSAVSLTANAGAGAQVNGDTALGLIESDTDEADGNVTVAITGEISRVDIVFTAGPNFPSGMIAQDVGIGPVSFTSVVIFDDSDGSDDGVVTGDANDNVIFGGTFADGGLSSGGGEASGADDDSTFPDDEIDGGAGNDRIYGGAGADSIRGGIGVDTIFGGDGANTIEGGADDDFIFGGSEAETISGGGDNDSLFGGGGADELNGNEGADRFILSASDAEGFGAIDGGIGSDTFEINFSDTKLTAELRGKVIQNVETLDIDAGANDVTVFFLDTEFADFGNVFFDRGANSNDNSEVVDVTMTDLATLNLSSVGASNFTSNDFFRVTGDGDGETITGTFINDSISGNGGMDSLTGRQGDDTLEGGAAGDTLDGGIDDDLLDGGADDDSIEGGDDDDTIVASEGSDDVDGGDDEDTYDSSAASRVFVDVQSDDAAEVEKLFSAIPTGTDTVSNVETFVGTDGVTQDVIAFSSNVKAGDISGLEDDATGVFSPTGGGANITFGPLQNYKISDILNGVSPDGLLPAVGPLGQYDITGGDEDGQIGGVSFSEFENIAFTIGPDGVVDGLDTGENMPLGYADADGDVITTGNDSILGNDGDDTIFGDAGDDTIDAGDGDDLVIGGTGADSMDGGDDTDTLSYAGSASGVVVNLELGSSLIFGDAAGDTFVNFENLTGSSQIDALAGDSNANVIDGGDGADALLGGGGNDTLLGGGGNDGLAAEADDASLVATYDGGADTDTLELDGALFSLAASTITDIEILNFDNIALDITVELTSVQLEGFDTVQTEAGRSGVAHQIDVEMGVATTADFSGVTFTNFDQSGDRVFILGDDDNETIIGTSINDVIASAGGEDNLSGGEGDDVFGILNSDTTIDGGADSDTYDAFFVDTLVASVDDTGAGFSNKFFTGSQDAADTFTNIETFVAGDAVTGDDALFLTTDVLATEVTTAIQGLEDTALGQFTDADGNVTEFGLPGGYLLSDILNGTVPSGTSLPAVGPIGTYQILDGDQDGQIGNIAFENFENINFSVVSAQDGVVDGLDTGDILSLGFTDAQGDQITTGADSIEANGGVDLIIGSGGADSIDAGPDGDTLFINASDAGALASFDGGDGGDAFVLDTQTAGDLFDLTGIDISNTELLSFTLQTVGDASVTLTADQANTNFTAYESGIHASDTTGAPAALFSHTWTFLMQDVTVLDLSDDTFGGTINGGDSAVILGDDDAEAIFAGDIATRIEAAGGSDALQAGSGVDTLLGGDDADGFTALTQEDFFGDSIDGGSGGIDNDTLDLSGLGPRIVIPDAPGAESGVVNFLDDTGATVGTLTYTEIENIICFTPGARIVTPAGEVPIGTLRVGDRVLTRDNGFQDIRWLGKRSLSACDLGRAPKLRPILIRKGALGADLPMQDLWVSPNHRMLQSGAAVQMLFSEPEVLIAAKHLTYRRGITPSRAMPVTYIHMMFDRHQIVLANGCWTESFYPGGEALSAVNADQYLELLRLFPELGPMQGAAQYPTARRALQGFESRALLV